jgi:APA family basic amino acid/polyamine antiporter
VFAGLARAFPEAQGPYDYVRTALGEPPAFFVMWSYWISIWVTTATISVAAVSYLSSMAPGALTIPGVSAATAIAFVWLFVIVACSGARSSGGVQIVTSFLKVLPLVAAVIIALVVIGGGGTPAKFSPAPVTGANVAATAALTLWAMLGFECATVPAARVRDPGRTIPRATIIGTLIAGLVYVTASIAVISCLGALNGWVLLQGEVPLSLANRGVFPAWFRALNGRGMPVRAQLAGAALSSALVAANYTRGLTSLFGFMALLATAATLVLYLLGALSALRLMALGMLQRGFLTALAIAGAVYAVWTFYGAGIEVTAWGAVLLATGIPVYVVMRWKAGSSRAAEALPAAPQE